jgi:hypothetical protein
MIRERKKGMVVWYNNLWYQYQVPGTIPTVSNNLTIKKLDTKPLMDVNHCKELTFQTASLQLESLLFIDVKTLNQSFSLTNLVFGRLAAVLFAIVIRFNPSSFPTQLLQ